MLEPKLLVVEAGRMLETITLHTGNDMLKAYIVQLPYWMSKPNCKGNYMVHGNVSPLYDFDAVLAEIEGLTLESIPEDFKKEYEQAQLTLQAIGLLGKAF